jgi:drug/metabolite transporter (DMT)-like permease
MSQLRYFTTIVFATFFMGSSFIASKILLRDVPPFTLVGWRFLLAALATLPLVFLTHPKDTVGWTKQNIRFSVLIGLLQTAGTMGLLFLSMQYISASAAAIMLFTNPIWVALAGVFILNETLNRSQIIGLLMGIMGVALAIGTANMQAELKGILLGLASALCWTTATITTKKAQIPIDSWKLNFAQMLVGGIFLVICAQLSGEKYHFQPTWEQVGWFLWLSIPSSTGSFGLWFLALRQGGAAKTSSYLFLTPMFTVLLSPLFLNTALTWVQVAGLFSVGLGIYLINRKIG